MKSATTLRVIVASCCIMLCDAGAPGSRSNYYKSLPARRQRRQAPVLDNNRAPLEFFETRTQTYLKIRLTVLSKESPSTVLWSVMLFFLSASLFFLPVADHPTKEMAINTLKDFRYQEALTVRVRGCSTAKHVYQAFLNFVDDGSINGLLVG